MPIADGGPGTGNACALSDDPPGQRTQGTGAAPQATGCRRPATARSWSCRRRRNASAAAIPPTRTRQDSDFWAPHRLQRGGSGAGAGARRKHGEGDPVLPRARSGTRRLGRPWLGPDGAVERLGMDDAIRSRTSTTSCPACWRWPPPRAHHLAADADFDPKLIGWLNCVRRAGAAGRATAAGIPRARPPAGRGCGCSSRPTK